MDKEAEKDYEEIWYPLLLTDGKFDPVKIKNEMIDLIFCFNQISKVYSYITGGVLSKPNYYADVIKEFHDQKIQDSYEEGWQDGRDY